GYNPAPPPKGWAERLAQGRKAMGCYAGQTLGSLVRRYSAPLCSWNARTTDRLAGGSPRCHSGEEPWIAAQPHRPSLDHRGSGGRSRYFTDCFGGAIYPVSFRAAHDVFDSLEASTGRAVA